MMLIFVMWSFDWDRFHMLKKRGRFASDILLGDDGLLLWSMGGHFVLVGLPGQFCAHSLSFSPPMRSKDCEAISTVKSQNMVIASHQVLHWNANIDICHWQPCFGWYHGDIVDKPCNLSQIEVMSNELWNIKIKKNKNGVESGKKGNENGKSRCIMINCNT